MKVLILGGTGPTGTQVIRELLETIDQISIVLYVRSPNKIPADLATNAQIHIEPGQLADAEALARAMEGVDAVLSCLGPSVKKGPLHPSGNPLAHAYQIIINVMEAQKIARLIALGTASIVDPLDSYDSKYWILINGVKTFARNAYKDVVAIGETIRGQGADLKWTIARVPVLTSSESKEYFAGYVGDGETRYSLSRAAFGAFVAGELMRNEWVQKAPLISG